MRRLWLLWIFALFAWATAVQAETPKEQLRALQKQGLAAYKAGKFDECAKSFAAALAMRPHYPRLVLNFAACSAKAGNKDDAIRALNEYADMGLIADVEKDEDFASLKSAPGFKAVLDKMHDSGKPVGESKIVARLTEPFLAEGIAYDGVGKRFFISSVDQRKIVEIASDGTATDFVPSGRDRLLLGAFGMAIDQKNRRLWVSTSGVAHASGIDQTLRGRAGIASYSLSDGSRGPGLYFRPQEGSEAILGDLTVMSDGKVFATDSQGPHILCFPYEPNPSPICLHSDDFVSLQGIAPTSDERALIVADYARGLHVVDRKTKAIATVSFAGGTTLLGIDGLYRVGNRLIAIQNGVAPTRILSMTLDASGRGIASVKVISANDPNIPEPSLGTIKDDEFCVVANAQWSRFNDDGTRKQDLDPPRIACIALSGHD